MEAILESKPIQFSGKLAFIFSLVGATINLIYRMQILNTTIVIVSGALGIVFIIYKIQKIRIEIIEKNENRIKEGKSPVEFPLSLKWKRKKSKNIDL